MTNYCTNNLVNEAIGAGCGKFQGSFSQKETCAKVYFFVLVNKELIFDDSILVKFRADGFLLRTVACYTAILPKSELWKREIHKLSIPLGSEVTILVQQVARQETDNGITIDLPEAISTRHHLGFSWGGGEYSSFSGSVSEDQAEIALSHRLQSRGLPASKIAEIINEMRTFHLAFPPSDMNEIITESGKYSIDIAPLKIALQS